MKAKIVGLALALVILALGWQFRGQFLPMADLGSKSQIDKYIKQAYALPGWWQAEGGVQRIPLPAGVTPALACTANDNPAIRSHLNTEIQRRLQALPASSDNKHSTDAAVVFVDASGNQVDCALRAALAKPEPLPVPSPTATPTPKPTSTPLGYTKPLISSAQAAEPAYQHKSTDRFLVPRIDFCEPLANQDGTKTARTDCQKWTAEELRLLVKYITEYMVTDPATGQTLFDKINGWPLLAVGGRAYTIIKPVSTPYGRDGYADLSTGQMALAAVYPSVFIHETFHIHDSAAVLFMPNAYVEGSTERATQMLLAAAEKRPPESYVTGIVGNSDLAYANQPALAFGGFQTDKILGSYMSYEWGAAQWADFHLVSGLKPNKIEQFRLDIENTRLKLSTNWDELSSCLPAYGPLFGKLAAAGEKPQLWMADWCLSKEPVWLFNQLVPTVGQSESGAMWWMTHFLMREKMAGSSQNQQYILQAVPSVVLNSGYLGVGLARSSVSGNHWGAGSKISIQTSLSDSVSPKKADLDNSGVVFARICEAAEAWCQKNLTQFSGKITTLLSATDPLGQIHNKQFTLPWFAGAQKAGVYGSVQPDNTGEVIVETLGVSAKKYSVKVEHGVFQIPELNDYYGEVKASFYNDKHQLTWSQTYIKPPGAYAIPVVLDEKPAIQAVLVEDVSGNGALVRVKLSRPGNAYIAYNQNGEPPHFSALAIDTAEPLITLSDLAANSKYQSTVFAFDDWGNMVSLVGPAFETKEAGVEFSGQTRPESLNLNDNGEIKAGIPLKIAYSGKLNMGFDSQALFKLYGVRLGRRTPIGYRLTVDSASGKSVMSLESDDNNNGIFGEGADNFRRYPTYVLEVADPILLFDERGEWVPALPESDSLLFDTTSAKTILLNIFTAQDPNFPSADQNNLDYLSGYLEHNSSPRETSWGNVALGGPSDGAIVSVKELKPIIPTYADIARFDLSPIHKNGLMGDGVITTSDYNSLDHGWWHTSVMDQLVSQAESARAALSKTNIVPGDLTGDGKVTPADVELALQIVVGNRQATPVQTVAMDVNKDNILDISDVMATIKLKGG